MRTAAPSTMLRMVPLPRKRGRIQRWWQGNREAGNGQAWILGSSPRMTRREGLRNNEGRRDWAERQSSFVMPGLNPGIHAGTRGGLAQTPLTYATPGSSPAQRGRWREAPEGACNAREIADTLALSLAPSTMLRMVPLPRRRGRIERRRRWQGNREAGSGQAWILGSSPRMTRWEGLPNDEGRRDWAERQTSFVMPGLDPGIHAGTPGGLAQTPLTYATPGSSPAQRGRIQRRQARTGVSRSLAHG